MGYTRRATTKDATWARAWTADAFSDLSTIAAILGTEQPHHGDIAFVTANGHYYLWLDDGSWIQITDIPYAGAASIIAGQWDFRDGFIISDGGADPVTLVEETLGGIPGISINANIYPNVDDGFTLGRIGREFAAVCANLIRTDGVQFPATQLPSGNVNVLDDYEEGTWTPIDASGAGLTFAFAAGTYTKMGNRVMIDFQANYPATADGTAMAIGGLPFTATPNGAISIASSPITGVSFRVNGGTTTVNLVKPLTGAHVTNAEISGAGIIGAGVYR